MRNATRPLRSLATAAALVAATVLVVLPGVHGAHAPHLALAASVHTTPLPALVGDVHVDAVGCALCAVVGQAHGMAPAHTPDVIATAPLVVGRGDLGAEPCLESRLLADAAPRAPPA